MKTLSARQEEGPDKEPNSAPGFGLPSLQDHEKSTSVVFAAQSEVLCHSSPSKRLHKLKPGDLHSADN